MYHTAQLSSLRCAGSKESNTNVSDAIVYLYIIDCFQLLIPYFGRAGGKEMVGKRRTRGRKRDHNKIHSLKRKCLCFLSRHVKLQSFLVKIGL